MSYPKVLGEQETLERVLAGESIARYGDGELKIMLGGNCVSQVANTSLAVEMRRLLENKTRAMIGIPTLDPRCPKLANWTKLAPRFARLTNAKKLYGSSFISRPDSAPWINTEKYFDQLESLWSGRRVTFVGNGVRSLTAEFLESHGASKVDWVKCPYRDAYSFIHQLYELCVKLDNPRIILCVGPTATCLAERLAQVGRHAIDLGHIGMFWRAYAEGRHTFTEQREINKETNKVEPNP
jgi:hypothetical protein